MKPYTYKGKPLEAKQQGLKLTRAEIASLFNHTLFIPPAPLSEFAVGLMLREATMTGGIKIPCPCGSVIHVLCPCHTEHGDGQVVICGNCASWHSIIWRDKTVSS